MLKKEIIRSPQVDYDANFDMILGGYAALNVRGEFYAIHHMASGGESTFISLCDIMSSVLPRISKHLRYTFELENLLFIDIETLALSPKSPVFLIGALSLTHNCVYQFIARTPDEEAAILEALAQLLPQKTLISFNGLSFDWPYLYKRSQHHQISLPKLQEHFDLLPYARSHWRHKLADCRLQTLEKHFCGRFREGDIPGFAIPSRYREFCQIYEQTGRGAHLILPIIFHNYWDLLTTAELFSQIAS